MGIWKAMISWMKKGSNHQQKRRARWGVLCGKEVYTERVEAGQNEKSAKSWGRSTDGAWGAPIIAEERRNGGGVGVCAWGKECWTQYKSNNPDRGVPVGIAEHGQRGIQCGINYMIVKKEWGVPTGSDERLSLQSCTAGGFQAACDCVIDECSGLQSNIYHRGWAICTLMFILRNQYCGLNSTGIFKQCTMNSCSC